MKNHNHTGLDFTNENFSHTRLSNTDFSGSTLVSVNFSRSVLKEVDFIRSELSGANFTKARLYRVNFTGAVLKEALFIRANLSEANFTGANIEGAVFLGATLHKASFSPNALKTANLEAIREDFLKVLDKNSASLHEVLGLRNALVAGKIDGTCYEGECACLVGTIAKLRSVYYPDLSPDSNRPSERWFLAIQEGDTPENNQVSEVTVSWIDEWLAGRGNV